jgi:hypothetical protein
MSDEYEMYWMDMLVPLKTEFFIPLPYKNYLGQKIAPSLDRACKKGDWPNILKVDLKFTLMCGRDGLTVYAPESWGEKETYNKMINVIWDGEING